MTMKKDAKFEKELTSSKLAWGIYQILTWALNNLKNLHFNRLLLTKVYNAEELRLMALKINKKIWRKTVVSQMVKIWWILIWALKSLKNLHFDWSFPVMLDLKITVELSFTTLETDPEFDIKLVVWKITWGIWQIFIRALGGLKIGTLMGFFCSKLKIYELKIYRGVLCHENEE